MIRRLAKLGFAFGLLAHFALGQTAGSATGTIQGVLFTADAGGVRSVLPATKISLDGSTHLETHGNDWAFVRGSGQANARKVHRSVNASDHYPISFELRFPG